MGDYQRWGDALRVWAVASTGLYWLWENEPRPHVVHPFGILSGPDVDMVAPDWIADVTQETSPGVFESLPQPIGVRVGTYGIRVVTRDQSPDAQAGRYLELARMSLMLPQVRQSFQVAGMTVSSVGPIRRFDATHENRVQSVAAMDLVLNLIPRDVGPGPDQGYIATVGVTSDLRPLPTPPNIEDEPIGPG